MTQILARRSDSDQKKAGKKGRAPSQSVGPTLLDSKRSLPTDILGLGSAIWRGDSESFLAGLPLEPLFDLVVTSPPYNIGKSYEAKGALSDYLVWQERIIDLIVPRMKDEGSLCWQVGRACPKFCV